MGATRGELLEPIDESMARLAGTVAGLSDQQVGGATLIPPWTRGHVLTHVARAADSLCRLLEGARTGVNIPQYASMEARAAEIEAGARRPVAALAEDVAATAVRFGEAVHALSEEAWERQVRMRTGELRTPASLISARLRELEIHHADLDAGYTFADIPQDTARWIVDDIADALARREGTPAMRIEATDVPFTRVIGAGVGAGAGGEVGGEVAGGGGLVIMGALADVLAWLTGRSPDGAGLTAPGTVGVPKAPYWI